MQPEKIEVNEPGPKAFRQTKEKQNDLFFPDQIFIPGRHHNLYTATIDLYWIPGAQGRPDCHGLEVAVKMGLKRTEHFRLTVPASEYRKMKLRGRAEVKEKLRNLIKMQMDEIY